MEEKVKMRIREALVRFSTNPTKLSKQFGVNQKTLNSQINDMTTLSVSTILLILEAIPELSAEWLLRGVGEMINTPNCDGNDSNKYYEICKLLLENKERENELYSKIAEMIGVKF